MTNTRPQILLPIKLSPKQILCLESAMESCQLADYYAVGNLGLLLLAWVVSHWDMQYEIVSYLGGSPEPYVEVRILTTATLHKTRTENVGAPQAPSILDFATFTRGAEFYALLEEHLDLNTPTEVFGDVMTVLDAYLAEVSSGRKVGALDRKTNTVLEPSSPEIRAAARSPILYTSILHQGLFT